MAKWINFGVVVAIVQLLPLPAVRCSCRNVHRLAMMLISALAFRRAAEAGSLMETCSCHCHLEDPTSLTPPPDPFQTWIPS